VRRFLSRPQPPLEGVPFRNELLKLRRRASRGPFWAVASDAMATTDVVDTPNNAAASTAAAAPTTTVSGP
jgi:hypothetical protein